MLLLFLDKHSSVTLAELDLSRRREIKENVIVIVLAPPERSAFNKVTFVSYLPVKCSLTHSVTLHLCVSALVCICGIHCLLHSHTLIRGHVVYTHTHLRYTGFLLRYETPVDTPAPPSR